MCLRPRKQARMTKSKEDYVDVSLKEPSTYDGLLNMLACENEHFASAYNKRLREDEGDSESDCDEERGNAVSDEDESETEHVESDLADVEWIGKSDEEITDDDFKNDLENKMETEEDSERTDNEAGSDKDNIFKASSVCSKSGFSGHLEHMVTEEEMDLVSKKKKKYGWVEHIPALPTFKWMGTDDCFLKDPNFVSQNIPMKKLRKQWMEAYENAGGVDFDSSKTRCFFSLCNSYRDILHFNKRPFYLKGAEEDLCVMDSYIIHSLNHVFKTKRMLSKNDSLLRKQTELDMNKNIAGGYFLDQGFTRPKVLILLPLASIAHRVITRLIQLTPPSLKVSVEYLDRFSSEFEIIVEEDNDDYEYKKKKLMKKRRPTKPSDFEKLLGRYNADKDDFMIGIKFSKGAVRLYSDFYSSDIIVASPAGLSSKIAVCQEDKEKDVDYLSSIEVLIIDHADVITMQNWFLVEMVVKELNRIPSRQHGTDIMRIREWYLNGKAQFYRQTIIFSSYLTPDINSTFNNHCLNFHGKVRSECGYSGVLPKVLLQVKQIYNRIDVDSVENVDDARLEVFSKKVFPKIKDLAEGGTMIFTSSYFEFVRVRNFLKSQDASFCLLGDYTKHSDISRARLWFFERKRKIVVYTERFHFYHRYKIRGIQNLILYSLPERKEFYPEVVNMLEESDDMRCSVLFSRFDLLRLERIVGTKAATKMVASEKGIFVFC